MAQQRKKPSLFGQLKKQVSPQTKVKLGQAAKKRKRQPKGSAHGGEFGKGGIFAQGMSHGLNIGSSVTGRFHTSVLPRMVAEPPDSNDPDMDSILGPKGDPLDPNSEWYGGQTEEDDQPKARPSSLGYGRTNQPPQGGGEDRPRTPEALADQIYQEEIQSMRPTYGSKWTPPSSARRRARGTAIRGVGRVFGPDRALDIQANPNIMDNEMQVRRESDEDFLGRINDDNLWQSEGYFPNEHGEVPKVIRREIGDPIRSPKNDLTITEGFGRATKNEREFFRGQTADPNSALSPNEGEHPHTARRRQRLYWQLRADQVTPDEALDYIGNTERRGRQGGLKDVEAQERQAYKKTATRRQREGWAEEDIKNKMQPGKGPSHRKDKYGSMTPSHKDFKPGVEMPGADSEKDIRGKLKEKLGYDPSEEDILKYRQLQRQAITKELLEHNQRWAHETRSTHGREITGERKLGPEAQKDDRVVFFTTNLGAPAPSVSANSLLGQYVIKKRKKMVVDDKLASRTDVKGMYPQAVRDQHLFELSTGISVGAEGRYGVFHKTGYKKGTKRSSGYGKSIPVGTEVLRDSYGRPVFDKDGNIRYTEGYTRPFGARTSKDIGLKIFLG